MKSTLLILSWDGVKEHKIPFYFDKDADFDLLVFDYSGKSSMQFAPHKNIQYFLSHKTESKGDLMYTVYSNIKSTISYNYMYIGFLDDDISVSVSEINHLIQIAEIEKLDVFQASLSHDSYFQHRQFIHKPGFQIIQQFWVEIMAPFYRYEVFHAFAPYLKGHISGYGVDVYLVPVIQKMLNQNNTAVIHKIQIKHIRPIRSDKKSFSNFKSGIYESMEMKYLALRIILENKHLFDKFFIKKIFSTKISTTISLSEKFKRVPVMVKNIYKELVNHSYR
jgi:hypothetical protein